MVIHHLSIEYSDHSRTLICSACFCVALGIQYLIHHELRVTDCFRIHAHCLQCQRQIADQRAAVLLFQNYCNLLSILTALVKSGLEKSRSDARRDVKQGGVSVDGSKVTDFNMVISKDALEKGILLQRGKKSYKRLRVE